MLGASIRIYPVRNRTDFYFYKAGAFIEGIMITTVVMVLFGLLALDDGTPWLLKPFIIAIPGGLVFYFFVIEHAWRNHFLSPCAGKTIEELVTELKAEK